MSPFNRVSALMVGILALVVIIVIIIVHFLSREIDIDRCLDAGGRYNYQTEVCEK